MVHALKRAYDSDTLFHRIKLHDEVSDILHELYAPTPWTEAGRPCSPRVLFCFQSSPSIASSKYKSKASD